MNCQNTRELFSGLYEESLGADEEARVRGHLAGCETCRAELEDFTGATDALRALHAGAGEDVPEDHVAAVMRAVDGTAASPTPSVSWRILSHAAAVLVGAMLVFSWRASAEEKTLAASSEPAESPISDVTAPVDPTPDSLGFELASGAGSLLRDGVERAIEPGEALSLRAGDVLRTGRTEGLVLVLGDDLSVSLDAPSYEPPVVPIPDDPVPDHPGPDNTNPDDPELVAARELVHQGLRQGLAALTGAVELLRQRRDRSDADLPTEPLDVAPVAPGPFVDPVRRSLVAQAPKTADRARSSAVRIRREGGRLSMSTRGGPEIVIPNLIAQLESDDPEVVQFVRRQLELIRADLEGESRKDRKKSRSSKRSRTGLAGLLFGSPDADQETASADPYLEWSAWWEQSALRGSSGTVASAY